MHFFFFSENSNENIKYLVKWIVRFVFRQWNWWPSNNNKTEKKKLFAFFIQNEWNRLSQQKNVKYTQ